MAPQMALDFHLSPCIPSFTSPFPPIPMRSYHSTHPACPFIRLCLISPFYRNPFLPASPLPMSYINCSLVINNLTANSTLKTEHPESELPSSGWFFLKKKKKSLICEFCHFIFYGWVIFCYVNLTHFAYPLSDWRTFRLLPIPGFYKQQQ